MVEDNYHCLLTSFVVHGSTLVIPIKSSGPRSTPSTYSVVFTSKHESKQASKIFVMSSVASEILTLRFIVVREIGKGEEESDEHSQVKRVDLFAKTKSSG